MHCVGHFGHIILEGKVFHMGYLPFVKKVLSCVCLKCSKLLVNKKEDELMDIIKTKRGEQRLKAIKKLANEMLVCQRNGQGCGTPVWKIKMEEKKPWSLIAEAIIKGENTEDKKITQQLTPEMCYNVLMHISDADKVILGLSVNRPEDLIHHIFPVPPVAVRPSARVEGLAMTREDDLTRSIASIVKRNDKLSRTKETIGTHTSKMIQDQTDLLQIHVASYFNNETQMMPKLERKGEKLKSLTERIKGKEGILRGHLMGKRVDFSARTVITPDPNIRVNQVGVPIAIAKNLTYPEIVTPYNIGKLTQLVKNGKDIYPGANFVKPKRMDGEKEVLIALSFTKEKINLKYGDIVERHLTEDDIVLFNRQPTLHKQSMMGHYVHVIDDPRYASFRMNVGVTEPYNADYDGKRRLQKIFLKCD
jgi:DNA-directed RNA polymerase II subunit RPB1